jgi:trk system potassium uptake protein TrkH
MHWRAIVRLFGILLLLYSVSFLPSILVSLWYADEQWPAFALSLALTASAGLILWLPNLRNVKVGHPAPET